MGTRLLVSLLGVLLILPASFPVRASSAGQNVDLMAKWTAATIVRYRIVAEFSGEAIVLEPAQEAVRGVARVTDRFEVDLEWNQQEYSLVGTPVIRNFPSTVGDVRSTSGCAASTQGAFEHATVVAVTNDDALRFGSAARLEYARTLPAGTVATATENGPCTKVVQVPAATPRIRAALPAPPGMMLAMPSQQVGYVHDGKSFSIKDASTPMKGWTYTVTPTIVR